MLPHVRIDRGGIRFLLAGALIMCPGLTSADAEGKQFAVEIGITKMGPEEMKAVNKGVAFQSITYVGVTCGRCRSCSSRTRLSSFPILYSVLNAFSSAAAPTNWRKTPPASGSSVAVR